MVWECLRLEVRTEKESSFAMKGAGGGGKGFGLETFIGCELGELRDAKVNIVGRTVDKTFVREEV